METPNTRSRRKRELNEDDVDEGGTVKWGTTDQKLRRAMLLAAAGKPIPEPSPTQQPNFGHFGANSSAGPSTGPLPKPARRRPCRAHRSLPSQLVNQSSTDPRPSAGRSTSVPAQPGDDGILGDLLAQALKTFGAQAQPMVSSSSSGSSARQSLPMVDGQTTGVRREFERQVSSGSSGSTSRKIPGIETLEPIEMITSPPPVVITNPPPPIRPALNEKPVLRNHTHPPPASRGAVPQMKPPPTNAIPTLSAKAIPTKSPASRNVPRVGLSSRPKQTSTTTPASTTHRPPGASQRFKPPFLQPQAPIRCSPRRHAPPQSHTSANHVQTPSKLRAGAAIAQRTALATAPAPAVTSGERSLRSTKVTDAPSSDSVGDESFDSFDGIFEAGGEDIDAILNMGGT